MSTGIAKLIALELGLLIVILAWREFSPRSVGQRPVDAEMGERAPECVMMVAPVLNPGMQRHFAEYVAASEEPQPGDEAVSESSNAYDYPVAAGGAYDVNGYAEPALDSPDYLVSPLDQIADFPRPAQIIILSQVRFVGHRHRTTPRFGGLRTAMVHQRPVGGGPRTRGGSVLPRQSPRAGGMVPPPKTGARPSRPHQADKTGQSR